MKKSEGEGECNHLQNVIWKRQSKTFKVAGPKSILTHINETKSTLQGF